MLTAQRHFSIVTCSEKHQMFILF